MALKQNLNEEYQGFFPSLDREKEDDKVKEDNVPDISGQMEGIFADPDIKEEYEVQTGPEPDVTPDTVEVSPRIGKLQSIAESISASWAAEDQPTLTKRALTPDPVTGLLTSDPEEYEEPTREQLGDKKFRFSDTRFPVATSSNLGLQQEFLKENLPQLALSGTGVATKVSTEEIIGAFPKVFRESLRETPDIVREIRRNLAERPGTVHPWYPSKTFNSAKAILTGITQGADFTTDIVGFLGKIPGAAIVATRGIGEEDKTILEYSQILRTIFTAGSNTFDSLLNIASPRFSPDEDLSRISEDIKNLRGPNAIAEFWNYLINDYTINTQAGQGISDFAKVFWPQVITDTVSNGTQPMWDAIYKGLEIDPLQRNLLTQSLTLGSSMFGMLTVPRGMYNMYKLGVVRRAGEKGAEFAANSRIGMPYMQEGGKMYNFIQPLIRKTGPWDTTKDQTKVFTGKTPSLRKGELKQAMLPREALAMDARAAIGTGSGYAIADMLFGGDKDSEGVKHLFAMASGIAAATDKGAMAFNAPWRILATAMYLGHRGLVGVGKKVGVKPIPGTYEGSADLLLYSYGYKKQFMLNLEKKAEDKLQSLVAKHGEEKAHDMAVEMNLIVKGRLGQDKLNKDFFKIPEIEKNMTAADRRHYIALGQALNNIDDPVFKADLQASMQRGNQLLDKLAKNVEGPDAIFKASQIQATLADVLHLAWQRNTMHHQMSKLELNLSGGIKKGKLINDIELLQRQIDVRSAEILKNINEIKLVKDADAAVVASITKMREFVTAQAKSKVETQKFLNNTVAKFSGWLEGKAKHLVGKERRDRDKILRIGEFGSHSKKLNDDFMYRSEQAMFGRQGEATQFKGALDEEYATFNRTGILYLRVNQSNNLYNNLFAQAEKLKNPVFINANPLDDIRPLLNEMYDMRIGRLVGDVALSKMYQGNPQLRTVLRERGLNSMKESLGNKYRSRIESIAEDLGIPVDKTADNWVRELEMSLIRYDDVIEDIPQMLSLREWHGLRMDLQKKERMYYKSRDYKKYNEYREAVDRIDNLFDNAEVPQSIVKNFEKAKEHYKDKLTPFRKRMYSVWQDNGGDIASDPSMYFVTFFSSGGKGSTQAHRNAFDEMFAERNAKGEIIYSKEIKELMHSALGRAFDTGQLTGSLSQIRAVWGDILPKKVLDEFDNITTIRELHAKGTAVFSPKSQNTLDYLHKAIANVDQVTATALGNSAFAQLAKPIGPERLGLTDDMANYISSLKSGNAIAQRAKLFDVLFGEAEDLSVAMRFAVTPDAAKRTLKPFDEVSSELGKSSELAVLQGKNIPTTPNIKEGINTRLEAIKKEAENALPNQVSKLEATPLEIIMASPLGKDKKFVEGLQALMIDELLVRNVKFQKELKVYGASQRWLGAEEFARQYGAKRYTPTIELGTELDVVGMRTFIQKNQKGFQALFRDRPKHLDDVYDLIETNVLLQGTLKNLNIKGGVGGYTLPMALGRAYNVMKGVVSARYAFLEGGIILARQKQAAAMMEIFKNPHAARIVREVFLEGKTSSQKITELSRVLFGGIGMDLTNREVNILSHLTYDIMDGVATTLQDRQDMDNIIDMKTRQRKERDKDNIPYTSTPSNFYNNAPMPNKLY